MATIERVTTRKGEARYRVRWWADGRRVEAWKRTADEAKALKVAVETDALGGIGYDPRRGAQRLDDYFVEWLPTRLVKGRPLTASTRTGYERLWRRNITDLLGRRELRSIRPEAVRNWHGEIVARNGIDQAAKSYRLLRAVLNTAEQDDLIRANPCRIRGGGQEHEDERPMVATELVLDLADTIEPRLRAIVLVAGFAGLRTGESLGLRRRDIDLLHGELHVTAQAQEVAGEGRAILAPKTEAGRRVVTVPSIVLDALDAHLAAYVAPEPDAWVFTGAEGGPLRRARLSYAWRAAVAVTDAPAGLRLHDLRHHALTLSARMPGVTTKELMARAGHASPRAALIYQHATAERDRAIADHLDAVIASTRRTPRAAVVGLETSRGVGGGLDASTAKHTRRLRRL